MKNRTNIVLWPGGEEREDCKIVQTLQELFSECEKYNEDDVYVVGGAMMYRTLLPYCTEALITKAEADGGAEVFFENLDKSPDWKLVEQSESLETNGITISFCLYKNKNVKRPEVF